MNRQVAHREILPKNQRATVFWLKNRRFIRNDLIDDSQLISHPAHRALQASDPTTEGREVR
jgi:hypothetical protein